MGWYNTIVHKKRNSHIDNHLYNICWHVLMYCIHMILNMVDGYRTHNPNEWIKHSNSMVRKKNLYFSDYFVIKTTLSFCSYGLVWHYFVSSIDCFKRCRCHCMWTFFGTCSHDLNTFYDIIRYFRHVREFCYYYSRFSQILIFQTNVPSHQQIPHFRYSELCYIRRGERRGPSNQVTIILYRM